MPQPINEPVADVEELLPLTPLSFHILLALVETDRHGYGILKEIERRTDGQMKTASGALYLAAVRLQESGMIEESDERPDPELDDRRRRYYRLTDLGRRVAEAEAHRLARLTQAAFDTGLLSGRKPSLEGG